MKRTLLLTAALIAIGSIAANQFICRWERFVGTHGRTITLYHELNIEDCTLNTCLPKTTIAAQKQFFYVAPTIWPASTWFQIGNCAQDIACLTSFATVQDFISHLQTNVHNEMEWNVFIKCGDIEAMHDALAQHGYQLSKDSGQDAAAINAALHQGNQHPRRILLGYCLSPKQLRASSRDADLQSLGTSIHWQYAGITLLALMIAGYSAFNI